MTARLTPAALSDSAAEAAEQERLAWRALRMATLDEVIDAGVGMIRDLAAQAAGTGPKVVEGDVALAYARFSRAVRQGILLQQHLMQAPAETAAAEAQADRGKSDKGKSGKAKGEQGPIHVTWLEPEQSKREGRRERVAQIVERMARNDGEPEETVERLYREAAERLEDISVYGDPAFRPISELVAEICRDLGLKPDWAVLATHPWAVKELALHERPKDDCLHEEAGWPLMGGPPPPDGWRGPWPPRPISEHAYDNPFPDHRTRPAALAELEDTWDPSPDTG